MEWRKKMERARCMELEEELKKLMKVWVLVLSSLCYCYLISSRIPKGMLRFLSISPVLYQFTILPFQLITVLPTQQVSLPSSSHASPTSNSSCSPSIWALSSQFQIQSFTSSPLHASQLDNNAPQNQNQNQNSISLFFQSRPCFWASYSWASKITPHKNFTPQLLCLSTAPCTLVYLLLDVVLGLCNILVNAFFGVELQLPSDDPYFSTSLRDFWGKRWNLMVTHILRHLS